MMRMSESRRATRRLPSASGEGSGLDGRDSGAGAGDAAAGRALSGTAWCAGRSAVDRGRWDRSGASSVVATRREPSSPMPQTEVAVVASSAKAASPGTTASAAVSDASGDVQAEPGAAASIYVHVVGAVRRPGLYEVPAGSRVADAVERAGGLLGSAAERALNLARPLADGEQIVVPTQAELEANPSAGQQPSVGSGAPSTGGGSPVTESGRRASREREHRGRGRAGHLAWCRTVDGSEDRRRARGERPVRLGR